MVFLAILIRVRNLVKKKLFIRNLLAQGKSPWIAPMPLTKYLSATEYKERQVVDTMHLRT